MVKVRHEILNTEPWIISLQPGFARTNMMTAIRISNSWRRISMKSELWEVGEESLIGRVSCNELHMITSLTVTRTVKV